MILAEGHTQVGACAQRFDNCSSDRIVDFRYIGELDEGLSVVQFFARQSYAGIRRHTRKGE